MPVIQERIKPTVHVRCAEDTPQEVLRQLQYGMEEEGIPWEAAAGTGDALSLAWEAARSSRLDRQALVLHYSKLEREQPLFRIPANSGMETVRALGGQCGAASEKAAAEGPGQEVRACSKKAWDS